MKTSFWISNYIENDALIIYTNYVSRYDRWYLSAFTTNAGINFDHPIENHEHGLEVVKLFYPEAKTLGEVYVQKEGEAGTLED